MNITQRQYTDQPGFTEDFHKVREFLVRINTMQVTTPHFPWGRWEWAFSLEFMDLKSLSKIGIWEDDGTIVGLATYENGPDLAYFCLDENYRQLKREMLVYAKEKLGKDGQFKALIPDRDREFQQVALSLGFLPTQDKEHNAVIDIDPARLQYTLPEGYTVTSLADNYDIYKYNQVLWRGFNHGVVPPTDEAFIEARRVSLSGPHVNLNLNIAVVSPEGEFVSYCGMWYDKRTNNALVEPVATDPAHRLKGCGRAAVLEAVRRCGQLGAKQAYVGSSQQFYYRIGFSPFTSDTFWECK